MASAGDSSLPYPVYSCHFRVVFPILDADGDLVTGAASLDSEASQDGGTFADCTNEATEIATSSGMYYLDIDGSELDTSITAVIVKTSTSGAKTTPLVFYPRRLPVLTSGTAQAGASNTITLATGDSAIDDFYNGCIVRCSNNSPAGAQYQARIIIDYVGSTRVATVSANWGTNPSSATTYEVLLTDMASNCIAANLNTIKGQAVTCGAGVTVLASVGTAAASTAQTGDAYARLGAPIGASISADIADVEGKVDDLEGRVIGTIAAGTHNPQSGDAYARLGAPVGASISADIADVEGKVDDLEGRVIGTIAAGTHNPQSGDSFARLGAPAGASVSADVAAVKVDTAEALTRLPDASPGGAGGLPTVDASNRVAGVSGNVAGSVASVTADVGITQAGADKAWSTAARALTDKAGFSLAADQSGVTVGTVNALGATAKTDVNDQVVDVIRADTVAEITAVPASNGTLHAMVQWIFALARNKRTTTASAEALRNDADGANIGTATVSDDATTFTRSKWT